MNTLDRAMAYLQKLPPAVAGSGGHNATLRAACELYRFGLSNSEAWHALQWFNAYRCQPVWRESELKHKLADAEKKVAAEGKTGIRTAMRNNRSNRVFVPPPQSTRRFTPVHIAAAARAVVPRPPSQPVNQMPVAAEDALWEKVYAENGRPDPAPPAAPDDDWAELERQAEEAAAFDTEWGV